MLELFEPEEAVGRLWHRLIGGRSSYPHHSDAAVTLDAVRPRLAVFFRALGGDRGVRLAAGTAGRSDHRLPLLDRIGLGTERVERAALDGDVLRLPDAIGLFPDPLLNERLYEWLAAFLAHADAETPADQDQADPLRRDVQELRSAAATTMRVLARWPGLARQHRELALAVAAIRPRRRLPPVEAAVERAALVLLGAASADGEARRLLAPDIPLAGFTAPVGYARLLPVPLWGTAAQSSRDAATPADDSPGEGGQAAEGDRRRRAATRQRTDQIQRDDPLILNRFEKMLSLAEALNIPRAVDDDDAENARKAADDLDEIAVGAHRRKAATTLKLDLDLSSPSVDATPLSAPLTYPEWDHRRQAHLPGHCRVIAETAPIDDGRQAPWQPDEAALRRIRQVRRQFEALRPRRMLFTGQPDGDDLDLAALVRSRADLRAGGTASDRVHQQARSAARDLAVAVLVDGSLSTDGWIDGRRVLDVEKEALLALTHGLTACGDDHALYAFTSRRRDWVRVQTLKRFDEALGTDVTRRIAALQPGWYTRMGAAIRHAAAQLAERPNRHRLLVLLTDGKPNDTDHYEGRYGIEDTRQAIREARRAGLAVFAITVDAQARDYVPYLFGRGGYAIFPQVSHLTKALPALYRQVACTA
ncbi:nitric oxide reductase activation protein NorD [Azospirillum picis]|uniref:Nitric oxide reductase NorD protein n=1 Tax=Azospirillum picis TaxID=488438 RepID=A0ABU0MLU8_9PROT|nr:VWA domain-containing protein [Azospirillum picis]MBP2301014.1 nitric oxide reductase NorD protein [Azospirillum picis]MDQ0534366.1 nitric oxide reductase NorD protein [Azospirillum picis]